MLIDTGSDLTFLPHGIAETLGLFAEKVGRTEVRLANGDAAPVYLLPVVVEFLNLKKAYTVTAAVPAMPRMNFPPLLGRDIISHFRISFDGPDGTVTFYDAD